MSNPETPENPTAENGSIFSPATIPKDLIAGTVVFLVALPLCLGIALASGAPLFSGLIAGIVGGLVVGALSGSHVSVSGPAAGLTAIVLAQIEALGTFEAFLVAVVFGGLLQIGMGVARWGFIAAFFPSSVIKGLLAAIGVILILKQFPHVFGHDADPEGEMSFIQPDQETTFSELLAIIPNMHAGAMTIGLLSVAILVLWDRIKVLKSSIVPAPLIVVLVGVALTLLFRELGGIWFIEASHLVQVPVAESVSEFRQFLYFPDFSASVLTNPSVYIGAVTIALVASLETLLNLEAVDQLDRKRRNSPPSRELIAQGVGNTTAGLLGGIPLTSVIIRGSVNVQAGAQTKLSAIFHGILLLVCVALFPAYLNLIPLSCLAAILLITGFKLASPTIFKQMYGQGRYQFLPFVITIVAIVFTDLLVGVLIGLGVALSFILYTNLQRPIRRIVETHLSGEVMHIELANQVSFLNRAALANVLEEIPRGGHVLLDARGTNYIDPDVLALLRDFKNKTAPIRRIQVSVIGFQEGYGFPQQMHDEVQHIDYSTRELQKSVTPRQVLKFLQDGNERFRTGRRLHRYIPPQRDLTETQHPLAVVLSCVDSSAPTELVFDLGLGDVFSVRVAGNIISRKVVGSVEYGCAVAGAKLVLVMGHTRCGAVTAAVECAGASRSVVETTGCQHIEHILHEIEKSMDKNAHRMGELREKTEQDEYIDHIARINVQRTVEKLPQQSETLTRLLEEGKIEILGAMYDVGTREVTFLERDGSVLSKETLEEASKGNVYGPS